MLNKVWNNLKLNYQIVKENISFKLLFKVIINLCFNHYYNQLLNDKTFIK